METKNGNYKQQKATGEDGQTVIMDPALTGETDNWNNTLNGPPYSQDDDDTLFDDEVDDFNEDDDEYFPVEEDLDDFDDD